MAWQSFFLSVACHSYVLIVYILVSCRAVATTAASPALAIDRACNNEGMCGHKIN